MKHEWQYSFTSKSLKFDQKVKYSITLHKGSPDSQVTVEGIIEIRPNESEKNKVDSSGTLAISIPFPVKEGTPIAHRIANEFGQKISFEFGDFQINWAILVCERIPETEEEKCEVGELTHQILQISMREVPEKQKFDPILISGSNLSGYNKILLRLFNDAELKKEIIDKYLTRFKILEAEFIDNNSNISAKKQLKSSEILLNAFLSLASPQAQTQIAFEKLIDTFVDARGNCAHLKKYKYGFLPGDKRLKDLETLELELRELCRKIVELS